jgi:predicted phosphodiesterase
VSQTSKVWVVLSDAHSPEEHRPSIRAVLRFLEANKVAGVVLLGDNMDCSPISRHSKGKPGLRRRGGWQADLNHFDKHILKPIEARIPKSAKRIFHLGNHERWLDDLLEEQPELVGALSIAKSLKLEERGWKVIPVGESSRIGKAFLVHGDQVGSGMHVAKKAVDAFAATVIMGHVHTAQMHTKCSQVKARDKWAGYVIPTLGTVAPRYAKGRPNSHVNGFGIVEELPDGCVNIYIPLIIDGRFSFAGKIYDGRKR